MQYNFYLQLTNLIESFNPRVFYGEDTDISQNIYIIHAHIKQVIISERSYH